MKTAHKMQPSTTDGSTVFSNMMGNKKLKIGRTIVWNYFAGTPGKGERKKHSPINYFLYRVTIFACWSIFFLRYFGQSDFIEFGPLARTTNGRYSINTVKLFPRNSFPIRKINRIFCVGLVFLSRLKFAFGTQVKLCYRNFLARLTCFHLLRLLFSLVFSVEVTSARA